MADIAAVTSIEITARDLTGGAISSVTGGLNRLSGAAGAAAGFLGALGVSLSTAAFAAAVKSAIDYADKLNDLAKQTGISVEMLGGLGYAAEQSGTSLEAVAKGSSKLATLMAEAAAGSAKAGAVFDAMGLSVKGVDGNLKPLGTMLAEIADRFASYRDGPEKAALANAYFGERLGAQLIPLLNEGGQKLRDAAAEFERYGGVTQDTAARADQFNDTLSKLSLMGRNLWATLAAALLPTLQAVANIFVEAKEKAGGFQGVAEGVTVAVKGLAIGAIGAVEAFKALGTAWGALFAALSAAMRGEFSSAWGILKEGWGDVTKSVATAFASMEKVATASTATIAAGAERNLNQKAAPATRALGDAAKKAGDGFKEMAAAVNRLYEDTINWIKAGEELDDMARDQVIFLADAAHAANDYIAAQLDSVAAYNAQTAAIGKTRAELADLEIARQAELRDMRLLAGYGEAAINVYNEWVAAIQKREVVAAQQEQMQAMTRMWQEVDAAAQDAFVNILQGGKNAFERLKDSLVNGLMAVLYQLTVRPFIINLAAVISGDPGMAGVLSTALGGGTGGGSNIMSLLSSGASLFGGGGTLFGSSLAGGGIFSSGLGATFATSGIGEALGLSVGLGAGEGMALTALGSMLGTAIPVIGAVIAIAALAGAFSKDPSKVRGQFGIKPGTTGFEDNAFLSSIFGNIGFLDSGTQQFSGEAAQVFNKVVGDTLAAFAERMSSEQISRLTTTLQGTDFGSFEGEYTTQEFLQKYGGDIMRKVISAAFGELDPALQAVFDGFHGTADEMSKFANVLLQVHDLTLNIPAELRATLIAALDGTEAMSEQIIAFAVAYGTLQEAMNSDPLADALEAVANAGKSAYGQLSDMADAFEDLIAAYDGSTDASKEITQATVDYYNALVNVIAGIESLKTSIDTMFGKTIEDMTLETLTDDEKKKYYQQRIAELYAQLGTATDPAEIDRITRQLNEYLRATFGLLTPDEQRSLLAEYADYARQINELAQERLQLAEDAAQARADQLFTGLRDVLTAAANDFKTAGADQKVAASTVKTAADTMLQAARTPIEVVLPQSVVNA